MTILLLLPTLLSLLLLAAHFFRAGDYLLTAIPLASLVLLLIPRRWSALLLQILLLLAAAEWLRSMVAFIEVRQMLNLPWTRLACILGGVFLWNILAALLFETPPLRRRYQNVRYTSTNSMPVIGCDQAASDSPATVG